MEIIKPTVEYQIKKILIYNNLHLFSTENDAEQAYDNGEIKITINDIKDIIRSLPMHIEGGAAKHVTIGEGVVLKNLEPGSTVFITVDSEGIKIKTDKSIKNEIKEKLKKYADIYPKQGIWKDCFEIEQITGIEFKEIFKTLNNDNDFIVNTQNKWTTRDVYEKYSTFFRKFIDSYTGKFT